MSNLLTLLSSVALGLTAIGAAIWGLVRLIMKLGVWLDAVDATTSAIKANTVATRDLSSRLDVMTGTIKSIDDRVNHLEQQHKD